jgi:3-phenylpropionate/cinnamic acid dioxygenase small subunit
MPDSELLREIEQFYYREAFLLDQRKFREWAQLFTADARYIIPARRLQERAEDELSKPGETSLVDDDSEYLAVRIKRIETGTVHAERVPTRTRHFVTNVMILNERPDEIEVVSNFLAFQSRYENTEHFFVGQRMDVLRRMNGAWQISSRKVMLDQTVLPRGLWILL